MKIEVGETYETRAGHEVTIINVQAEGSMTYTITGKIKGRKATNVWKSDGKWELFDSPSSFDIVCKKGDEWT